MNESLKSELNPGEKLLWSSSPEPFEPLDKTNKKAVMKKMIITGLAMLLIICAYIAFALIKGGSVKIIVVLVLLLVAVCACINSFLDANKLKESVYAATDSRIIFVSDTVKSVEYKLIDRAVFSQDEDGHYSLLCGKAIGAKPEEWRSIAVHGPHINKAGLCERFALYAVPEHEKVKNILSEYISF